MGSPTTAGKFIECAKCHDRIRSENRHDFRRCRCGETFVDGGDSYLRAGGYPVMAAPDRIAVFDALEPNIEDTQLDLVDGTAYRVKPGEENA